MAFITSIVTWFTGDDVNKKADEQSLLKLIAFYEASHAQCIERANENGEEFEEKKPKIKVIEAYIADLEQNPFCSSVVPHCGSGTSDSTVYLAKYKKELAQIYGLQSSMHMHLKHADEWVIKICEAKQRLAKLRGFK
jgi:hypothetical protein